MSQLLERLVVQCPYHLAQRYLADDVGALAASKEESHVTLSVSVPGLELVKNVLVRFEAGVDPMHFDQPWRVHWMPQAGPYPEFDGQLTVRADENYESALLELTGSYRPPAGVLGSAFDWVAGSRIASASARALLASIAEKMEARYQADERSKRRSTVL